ncbi:MAG: hypothetical protein GC191_17835 [Azospirillum sp.]|nr:hypothetical protein [Azospirillum sp.]
MKSVSQDRRDVRKMSLPPQDPKQRVLKSLADKEKIGEITCLQERLDQAEAELAALTEMARMRGCEPWREQSRPLLKEMAKIVSRLNLLILGEPLRPRFRAKRRLGPGERRALPAKPRAPFQPPTGSR